MPELSDARRVRVGDITLGVRDCGPTNGPALLLIHGWPEFSYTWARLAPRLADAGYRVIAPDLRGFGASDAPADVDAYAIDPLIGDAAGLLDALDVERAVFVGHDWGGILVWAAARLISDRVSHVIALNTPHHPRPPAPPTEILKARYGPEHYIVWLQEMGVERVFEDHLDRFFAFMFGHAPDPAPADPRKVPAHAFDLAGRFAAFTGRPEDEIVIPPADRAAFVEAYRRTGLGPGVNLYRNMDANWRRMADVSDQVDQPALMIGAANDWFLPPGFIAGMPPLVPRLETAILADCGHWTTWEKPAEAARIMIDWLRARL